jgi:hypothetical protein
VLAKTDLPSSDIETLEHRILARALAVIELRIPVVIDKLLHERMDNLFTQLASRMEQELSQSMTNEVAGIVHEAVTHAVKRAVRGERASDSPIT